MIRLMDRPVRVLQQMYQSFRLNEQIYMVLLGLVVGLLGGLGAVGFRLFIRLGSQLAWHKGEYTLAYIGQLPFWWKILAPAAGGLVVGVITYYFASEAKGHGVPEVMESVMLRGGRIRPRVVLAKLSASAACIASGGSVGREGPIIQIGSAIGSTLGQWLGIGQRRLRTLVGCGAAAGIAGTFNAPVAGALFAVEIILGDFGVSQFSPIVISSVAATVVSRHFLGDHPALTVPAYHLVQPYELFAYAVLGLLAGLVALAFIRSLYGFEDLFDRMRLYGPLKPVIGGLMIGLIALWLPQVYGVGYEAIGYALNGQVLWKLMLALVVVKILAVSITLGSGGSGGIFAPSLFIGAMLGGAVGTFVHSMWPNSTADPGAYALVGMGAVVAAGTHAPITAILIIFEMTADYKIMLPLMISCIIATLLTMRLERGSIYTMKLLRRGVRLSTDVDSSVLRSIAASELPRKAPVFVGRSDPLQRLMELSEEADVSDFVVVDGEHRYRGMVLAEDIRVALLQPEAVPLLVVEELLHADVPVVHPHDSLDVVLAKFAKCEAETLAMVAESDKDRVIGLISRQGLLNTYQAALARQGST